MKHTKRNNRAVQKVPPLDQIVSSRLLSLTMIGIVSLIVYSVTLSVPFYLDDFSSIRENFAIRDLWTAAQFAPQRAIGYMSFSLNFMTHGYDLLGYHLVNIAIHILCSIGVYYLARALRLCVNERFATGANLSVYFPLLVALIFAVHPLQTQAVTYIVQRSASLAAMFYVFSMTFYVYSRIADGRGQKILLGLLVLLCGLAAVFTKQNAVTLPAAILLVEVCFLGLWGHRLIRVLGILATLLVLVSGSYYYFVDSAFFASLSSATLETELVSRTQYLAIQMGVIWLYIAKFIVPANLHLMYEVPITDFSSPGVWLYLAGHVALIGTAFYLIRRAPLVAFGILFYYLAHSVESGIIPIRDFAFEHRTYLPNLGLCLVAAYFLLQFLPQRLGLRQMHYPALALVVLLAGLTWQRNSTWADPEAFYQHEIAINPEALRPRSILGEYYLRQGEDELAVQTLSQATRFIETSLDRQNNTRLAFYQNLILALHRTQRLDEAMAILTNLDWASLPPSVESRFRFLRGNVYADQSRVRDAEMDFVRALELDPGNLDAKLSYGKVLYIQARLDEAEAAFNEFMAADPYHPSIDEALIMLDAIADIRDR